MRPPPECKDGASSVFLQLPTMHTMKASLQQIRQTFIKSDWACQTRHEYSALVSRCAELSAKPHGIPIAVAGQAGIRTTALSEARGHGGVGDFIDLVRSRP